MLKQLWVTGILVAFSVFGVKVGLGLGSLLYSRTIPGIKKVLLFFGTGLIYFILFCTLYLCVTRFNLLNYLDRIMNMIQYGMLLHLAVALGLLFWGTGLLLQNSPEKEKHLPGSVLLLILPCPVCATVILLNLTLAYSVFSISSFVVTLILFTLFFGIIIIALGVIFPARHKIGAGNSFLGMTMVMISLYFLMTVIIAPIYPDIKAAFTMACSNSPVSTSDTFGTAVFAFSLFLLGGIGFINNYFLKKD